MQLIVSLHPDFPVRLPFSYYHSLSASVYETFRSFDESFAQDLHNGSNSASRIKLLTISPLFSNVMEIHGGRKGSHHKGQNKDYYLLFKGTTFFRIATPLPNTARTYMSAFSNTNFLRIGSQVFRVNSVEILAEPIFKREMTWISPENASIVTSWSHKGERKKLYQFPVNKREKLPDSHLLLERNLIHKWKRLVEKAPEVCKKWTGEENASSDELKSMGDSTKINVVILTDHNRFHYKTRLHQLKNTPVRSWRSPVKVIGPAWIQRLIWSCGLGQLNTMGFGLVQEILS